MDVTKLLHELALAPEVEVVVAGLPELLWHHYIAVHAKSVLLSNALQRGFEGVAGLWSSEVWSAFVTTESRGVRRASEPAAEIPSVAEGSSWRVWWKRFSPQGMGRGYFRNWDHVCDG